MVDVEVELDVDVEAGLVEMSDVVTRVEVVAMETVVRELVIDDVVDVGVELDGDGVDKEA